MIIAETGATLSSTSGAQRVFHIMSLPGPRYSQNEVTHTSHCCSVVPPIPWTNSQCWPPWHTGPKS